MRKMAKRVLAYVCTLALIVSSLNVLSVLQANANSASSPGELTKVGWTDVGITEDTTIVGGASDANNWGVTEKPVTSGKNLVNSSFRGILKFRRTTSANQYFQYGAERLSTMGSKGIRFAIGESGELKVFNMANGGELVETLDATTAGLRSGTFVGTAFELGIDVWQPEGSADLKMIVYIDKQQYGSEPYVITNGAANMNAGMVLVAQGEGDFIDITVPVVEKAPDNLASVDWTDVGITEDTTIVGGASDANNWGVTEKPVTSGKNLVNSSFRGTLKFRRATSANQYFQYGAERLSTMGSKGIRFAIGDSGELKVFNMANGGSEVVILDATTAGLRSGTFVGTAFELGIDVWQPEGSADLKMIVYIDQQQYGSEPYVITNGAANMNAGMVLVAQGEGDFIDITVPVPEKAPDNLASVDWTDIGITEDTTIVGGASDANNWGVNEKPITSGKSLVNSSFRGTLKFRKATGANLYFQYGAESLGTMGAKGIRFAIGESGELKVFNMANGGSEVVILDAATAGLSGGTFVDTAFELGIDVWQPSGSADLKLIVYINNQQYGSEPYVITNGAANMNAGMVLVAQGEGDFIDITVPEEEDVPGDLTSVDWSDIGITENTTIVGGASDANNWGVNEKPVTTGKSLVNSSFRGTLKFRKATGANLYFQYGAESLGTMGTKGIRFAIGESGELKVFNMANGGSEVVILDATTAGLSSGTFVGTAFELGIDVWQPAGSADLNMIVYIDKQPYRNEPYVITNGAANMNAGMVLVAQGEGDFIDITVPEGEKDPSSEDLTSINWKSFGITTDKTCRATGDVKIISENPVATLSGTSFRGNLTFHRAAAGDTLMLSVGCSANGWDGLRITQSDDTLSLSGIQLNAAGVDFTTTITKEMAQVDSFSNQEMILGLDIWTLNQKDYKIHVYVNGSKVTETPIIWKNAVTNGYLQNNLAYYVTGASMIEMLLHEAPDVVPDDLKSITWEDLKIDEDDYGYITGGFSKIGTSANASLKNVSFRGKMKFIGTGAEMTFGDNSDGWQLGLNFVPQEDGTLRVWNRSDNSDDKVDVILNPAQVGLESFLNQEFELGVDAWADGNNLKYIVYVNGIRYNAKAYIWKGGATSQLCYDYLTVGLLVKDRASKIAVLYPEVEQEASPEGLKKITWADFAIDNKKYTLADTADRTGLLVKSNSALTNLLNTSFSGKIQFNKLTTDGNLLVCYGANGWNWDGIRIFMTEDGKLRFQGMDLENRSYPIIVDVTTKKAGVESFNGEVLTLGIDIWKSGDDAKINIFVNGVQCTTRAYVWKDAVKNKCVGNGMNLVVDKDNDSLTVESIVESVGDPIQPATSLKEISFSSFGIADKVYRSKHPDFAAQGGFFDPVIGKSLNGTLLNVDLCFSGDGVEFRYGGMNNAWEGLVIRSSGRHLLLVDTSGLLAEFVPEYAGTELTNQTLNLKISLNYVDSDHDGKKDDVKLGFWFDDVLYKNQFIYLNNYAATLGSKLGIYIPEGTGTLGVSSAAVDNSINFGLFGFTKNFKKYLIETGIPKEIRTKL